MSLMKLLSVSKSFADSTNQLSRYKMAEQGLLPKFAPMGRPVSLAPKRKSDDLTERQAASPPMAPPSHSSQLQSSGASGPVAGPPKTVAPKMRASLCANANAASTNWFRLGNNPFVNRPAGRPKPPALAPAERSLDAVKPVRNDLSDSDLQVVPAKIETPAEASKSSPPRWMRPELTGLAWSRLTARFFSSERVRA